ncbi:hypothetical protein LY78DRAFT_435546 [Colletotrichum sublineola]|nr:hypothetical protein LY78DRAFT_435546 [Colletotrichum sublineola]
MDGQTHLCIMSNGLQVWPYALTTHPVLVTPGLVRLSSQKRFPVYSLVDHQPLCHFSSATQYYQASPASNQNARSLMIETTTKGCGGGSSQSVPIPLTDYHLTDLWRQMRPNLSLMAMFTISPQLGIGGPRGLLDAVRDMTLTLKLHLAGHQ